MFINSFVLRILEKVVGSNNRVFPICLQDYLHVDQQHFIWNKRRPVLFSQTKYFQDGRGNTPQKINVSLCCIKFRVQTDMYCETQPLSVYINDLCSGVCFIYLFFKYDLVPQFF